MDDDLQISDRLRQAIRDVAERERLEIPEAFDSRIRAAARRPRGRLLRLRRAIAAAAAAVLLALGLWVLNDGPTDKTRTVVGDLDADGVVDIVDAYLLDRRLASAPARGDVTGDGRVDATDLHHLIEMVVSVGGQG